MTDELIPGRAYRLDLGRVNAYPVETGETTLIDAGAPNAGDDLRSELDEAGYDVPDIDRVLITQFDLDHVGTLAHPEFEGPIYAAEPDASFLDGSRKPPLSNHKGLLQRLTDFWLTRPSRPVRRLSDGGSVRDSTPATRRGTRPGTRCISTTDWALPSSVTSWPRRTAPSQLHRGYSRTAPRRMRTAFVLSPIPVSLSTSLRWATGRQLPRTEVKHSLGWLDSYIEHTSPRSAPGTRGSIEGYRPENRREL